ncbi:MAG: alpha/beta hydrolase [Cyclobacteriaceae bacterium]|nr:alpha/beta hydrolase [Cyclobacteriaceae bacterium]
MLSIVVLIVTVLLIALGVLLFLSPGVPKPFLDNHGRAISGSISEKIFITIGGIRQGMFIKSKNVKNPVLLYLHGGIPDYFLSRTHPTGLDEYFTVVWWDQRGSGLSYNSGIPLESKTLDQLLSDTKELSNYLRTRFAQDKIYIMGRSGGTFIGIYAAAKSPELYHAYIGIGQMSDQLKSERIAYEYILKEYQDRNDRKMVEKLMASPVKDSIPYEYLKLRDQAMHRLGIGTTHDMKSVVTGLFIPSLLCSEYTLQEKINLWRGKSQSGVHPLWNNMISTDLAQEVNEVNIPVYFFHGKYDYTVSYSLAKQYLETLHAPVKGFYTFENAAHSPHFEDPERVKDILINDVFGGKVTLADK